MTTTMTLPKQSQLKIVDNLMKLDISNEEIFTNVLLQCKEFVNFDAASIYLFNPETEFLEKLESYSKDVECISGFQNNSAEQFLGTSSDTMQPILIHDRTKKKSFNPDTEFASYLSVPITNNNIIYGLINFGCHKTNSFTKEHVKLLESATPFMSHIINYYHLSQKKLAIQASYSNSLDNYNNLKSKMISEDTVKKITTDTADVIHGINNSLSIILGNLQCILLGKNEFNQKSLSRLRRIETAAKKISESNSKILDLNSLVNNQIGIKPKL